MTPILLQPLLTGCLLVLSGLGRMPSAGPPRLDLQTLEQLSPANTRRLAYEERRGRILVWVTDRTGDSHVHVLDPGTASRARALEALRKKQQELPVR